MPAANPELSKRMRKASSMIALGSRRNNTKMLAEGRRLSAVAHIENQILLGRELLSNEDAKNLATLLFEVEHVPQHVILSATDSYTGEVLYYDQDGIEEDEPEGL